MARQPPPLLRPVPAGVGVVGWQRRGKARLSLREIDHHQGPVFISRLYTLAVIEVVVELDHVARSRLITLPPRKGGHMTQCECGTTRQLRSIPTMFLSGSVHTRHQNN